MVRLVRPFREVPIGLLDRLPGNQVLSGLVNMSRCNAYLIPGTEFGRKVRRGGGSMFLPPSGVLNQPAKIQTLARRKG
jgi:hypothetical protein